MAAISLEGLKTPDEIAYAWSRFLIEDLIEKRNAGQQPIPTGVFVFELDDGIPTVPSLPTIFDPVDHEAPRRIIDNSPHAYAYLAVMTGLPVALGSWAAETGLPARQQLIGVPYNIIEAGDFPFYLMAIFYSRSIEVVFCAPFDGKTFSKVQSMYGSYGGVLSDLFRRDA